MKLIKGLGLILLAFLFYKEKVEGEQIVLDYNKDILGVWLDVSCHYQEDYNDFWVYGCPTKPSSELDDPTGFWSACHKSCEIIYYGGHLPNPAKLILSTYIEGDTYIEVSGKNKPEDSNFNNYFGYLDAQFESGWCSQEFDLSTFESTTILNITVTGSTKGFVLLDKITVDIGEEILKPMTLDVDKDELPTHWTDDGCHYFDNYEDFWVFGCPAEPQPGNPISEAIGYWSPCTAKSCAIKYSTSPSIIPISLEVSSYVNGSAELRITAPRGDTPDVVIKIISVEETGEGWYQETIDLSVFPGSYDMKFELVSATDGIVLLDKLSVSFSDGSKSIIPAQNPTFPPCIKNPLTTSTTMTTTTTKAPPTSSSTGNTGSTISNTGSTTPPTDSTTGFSESTTKGGSMGLRFSNFALFLAIFTAFLQALY